jgi:intracellular multiplication protein IcmK
MLTMRFMTARFGLTLVTGLLLFSGAAIAQQSPQPEAAPTSAQDQSLDQFVTPPAAAEQEQKNEVTGIAFQSALDSTMPLRPDQIQQLISRMSDLQQATASPPLDPARPTPVVKVETVSLDPSGEMPEIKLAAGYVSTIMVLDATGAPWPIKDIAFAGKFEVRVPTDDKHILRVIPLNRFNEGNLTIQLQGLAAPVIFKVTSGNREVYYRYDVRIPALGPNARPPRFESAMSIVAGDPVLMSVLDGYPPSGAKRLDVKGVDSRSAAWEVAGQIYLRTPHSLLSPAWSNSASSGDGTTVYLIPDTPVLLLSDQGLMVRARIERPLAVTAGDSNNEH